MPEFLVAILGGVVAGLIAAAAMNLFQRLAAPLFGQPVNPDDPANEQAADDAVKAARGTPIRGKSARRRAGSALHYATGAAMGAGYALLVLWWPPAAALFGVAFGIAVAIVLDYVVVPAFGWGRWPWETDAATHAYGLASHAVFGLVLEAVRRLVVSLV